MHSEAPDERSPLTSACSLCDLISRGGLMLDRELAAAVPDGFPLTPGHSLVIPRRHEPDFFALTDDERVAILNLIVELHALLKLQYAFDGINLGLNNLTAAGQTVPHAHMHLIPRYTNDVPDPRGGVRWIFPDRAAHWITPERPPG